MEVDSRLSPSSSRLRGLPLAKPSRMSKRERSPDGPDAAADRPSKRPASKHNIATTGHQTSEDWVQQASGLSIHGSAGGNYQLPSLGFGVAGPGPSTSAQMDEDFTMAVEEDTAATSPLQEERHGNPPSAQHQIPDPYPTQLLLPQRSQSLPNPSVSSGHPYGHQWPQLRTRNADGSPLINVVPATPAGSQQSLAMIEAPLGHGVEHHRHPQSAQNAMLQAPRTPRGTPPPSDPNGMSVSTPPLGPLMHPTGKNKRVAFGPRLDCEKCRQGEIHFAHVHYE